MIDALVEVVLLSARDGHLRYRTVTAPLDGARHPDSVARSLAGKGTEMLHSTAWRHERGRIILTYAALPDPRPTGSRRLTDEQLVASADARRPSPGRVTAACVATHACRHLAFLYQRDPVVAEAGRRHPELWDLLTELEPAVANLIAEPA